MSSSSSSPNNHPCAQPTLQRQECHMNHGIQNEECIREELTEKRCLAELHCQREAINFYHRSSSSSRTRWSCSALMEKFAFPENEMVLPERVAKEDREHCRKVVYDLARCLSRHGIGRAR
mmetsp:Transcript_15850/g.26987  ORF Transcript_15850/g.26987 Transcript_15850/m.26987 type:complete len:120 (-) Transcript_15850:170-529(-)|eukprot:scaffold39756_cov562-Skeletonema_marinoi.AAC.1